MFLKKKSKKVLFETKKFILKKQIFFGKLFFEKKILLDKNFFWKKLFFEKILKKIFFSPLAPKRPHIKVMVRMRLGLKQ